MFFSNILKKIEMTGLTDACKNKTKKNYFFSMTPQASRAPLLPAGLVIWSSGPAWMSIAVPLLVKSVVGPGNSVTSLVVVLRYPLPSVLTSRLGRSPV
jgi:hypothetical protein